MVTSLSQVDPKQTFPHAVFMTVFNNRAQVLRNLIDMKATP